MRCPQCASDNPPEYRFCGMCGTPLDKKEASVREPVSVRHESASSHAERVEAERRTEAPRPLSGPSFLGLGSEPARGNGRSDADISYLFDDEDVRPRRTYWRFMLLLLFVAIIGGLVYLQYVKEGKSWVAPWAHQQPTTPIQASQPEQQAPAPQPSAAQPDQAANPPAGNTANPQNPAASESAATAPSQSSQKSEADNAGTGKATDNSAKSASAAPDKTTESAKAENPADNSAAEEAEAPPAKPARAPKPKAARAVTPAVSSDDVLVNNAEKYLYGRGVPQNCDRALSALRSAADHQNERARSLLGTMYATGHCVPKDLPNAYRWFAQASRQSPDNMWVQRNLEMIWREMTPQERQLATRSQ